MTNNVINHTRKLLVQGVFDHLNDERLSVLHHLIIRSNDGMPEMKIIFDFWRKGSYTGTIHSMQMLQETNAILSCFGEPQIHEIFEEVSEIW